MKKLEDFNCEKVNISSIYGGRKVNNGVDSMTIVSTSGQIGADEVRNDGPDQMD